MDTPVIRCHCGTPLKYDPLPPDGRWHETTVQFQCGHGREYVMPRHDSASASSGTTRPAVSDMEPSTTGSVRESSR
jgi:hypothetical protein